MRYFTLIVLVYLNTALFTESLPRPESSPILLGRLVSAAFVVLGFFVALILADRYWDGKEERALGSLESRIFSIYWWLRYPALILVTFFATRFGLQL